MFYLELKDGEKIFTGNQEDDHAAYRKIIEDKLGKDALRDKLRIGTAGLFRRIGFVHDHIDHDLGIIHRRKSDERAGSRVAIRRQGEHGII